MTHGTWTDRTRRAVGIAVTGAVALAWSSGPAARATGPQTGRGGPYLGIVIADPRSDTLGAAGASCGLRDAASMATIDPMVGALVTEPASPARTEAAVAWLGGGSVLTAGNVPATTAAVRAGAAPNPVTIGRRTLAGTASALIYAGLPRRAARDAGDSAEAPGASADRLLSALEAAWPAGACHGRPSAAFLVLASPGEGLIAPGRGLRAARLRTKTVISQAGGSLAADELSDRLLEAAAIPHPEGQGAPDVYLSLMQPPGGFAVIPLLRQAYEQTSSVSGTPSPSPRGASETAPGGRAARIAVVGLLIGLAVAVFGIARRLRQMNDEP